MNSLAVRSLQQVRGLATTRLAATSFKPDPTFKRFKDTQEKYQIPDGRPVYLKGGMMDRFLFHVTGFLCVVGLGMSFKFIIDQALPESK